MTNAKAINVLLQELQCIERNDGVQCDRKCESCDLVMDAAVLKDAYNMAIKALESQEWIPCSEKLPEGTVIVTAETKTFKHKYVCEAVWIPRWTWKAEYDNWEDCTEYNEDEDEYYVLEGWYERVHNWDEYSYVGIEDDVIAWMPLPKVYLGE